MAPSSDVFSLRDNVALYRCLGVERNATEAEIKRAWRRLAAQYHPDKNPTGEERFKECEFAYRVLSDPEQRRLYDSTRLRAHINSSRPGAAGLDPDAELTPEALRDFIASLINSEREQEERRRQFDAKRRDECARRAQFDAEHPGFTMPELPSVESVRAKYGCAASMVTTAELRANLNCRVEAHEDALARYGSLPGCSAAPCPPAAGAAAPRRGGSAGGRVPLTPSAPPPANALPGGDALDAFRQQGACANQSARQRALDEHRRRGDSARGSDEPRFRADLSFTQSRKQYYNSDVNHIRAKVGDFDYTRYVQEQRHNREKLSDAILSDALEGYAGQL